MFFGGRELILFEGVVEDRNDPLFLGRVRVRAIGFHDPDKQKIPTDTLPWAMPLLPADDGKNVVGYKEGDFVAGYFRDGESRQYPVIIGKIPGIPENPANPEVGYNDPTPSSDLVPGKVARPPEMIPPPSASSTSGENQPPAGKYDNPDKLPTQLTSTGQLKKEYGSKPFPYDVNGDGKYDATDASLIIDPNQNGIIGAGATEGDLYSETCGEIQQVPISRYPLEHQLKESVASRLARHEKIEQTLVARKKCSIINAPTATHAAMGVGTDKANEGEPLTEPETPYDAKYPYNHVYESESGHVIEYDDTPLVERLHSYHRSGTFREIHPDGKQIDKSVNDRYDLSLGDSYYESEKNVKITAKDTIREFASKAMVLEAGTEMAQDSGGDRNIFVGKNANTRVKKNVYTVIEGDVRILIKGNLNVAVEGDIKVKSKQDVLIDGQNIKTTAQLENVLEAGVAVVTEGPLTYTNTAFTDGVFIRARYADEALISDTSVTYNGPPVIPVFAVSAPPTFVKENDADNKDNLVTTPKPKEGYVFNGDSMVKGSKQSQDLFKPVSDSDGKAVVLSASKGQQAKFYEALPTGDLQDANLQYLHLDGTITQWAVKRPGHKKGRLIEAGRYSGNGNGGREHWRFKKPGGEYPSPMILQIGDKEYLIVESVTRHEAI